MTVSIFTRVSRVKLMFLITFTRVGRVKVLTMHVTLCILYSVEDKFGKTNRTRKIHK